ncbi:hypothetical protein VNO78_25499 [Psophocarpus tetragonolobus]|uniref:Uncharacterized protein n=1 Tax=Psophocarpus tetragonolobus TaxID=3891 RepID=A0AAN9S7H9_PSOTE
MPALILHLQVHVLHQLQQPAPKNELAPSNGWLPDGVQQWLWMNSWVIEKHRGERGRNGRGGNEIREVWLYRVNSSGASQEGNRVTKQTDNLKLLAKETKRVRVVQETEKLA